MVRSKQTGLVPIILARIPWTESVLGANRSITYSPTVYVPRSGSPDLCRMPRPPKYVEILTWHDKERIMLTANHLH